MKKLIGSMVLSGLLLAAAACGPSGPPVKVDAKPQSNDPTSTLTPEQKAKLTPEMLKQMQTPPAPKEAPKQ